MEALYQDLTRPHDSSISVLNIDLKFFLVPWHYHPDTEIILITEGEGLRFVGDHVDSYRENDLVIVGSNLPHVWKSSKVHYDDRNEIRARCKVVHFREEEFGSNFWNLPSLKPVTTFLGQAGMGIHFSGSIIHWAREKIFEMEVQSPFDRLISLMELLKGLEADQGKEVLSSTLVAEQLDRSDGMRFNRVLEFIATHFRETISLEDISRHIHLTPTSFCRYFKDRTQKSFTRYLIEYRLSFACKMLTSTESNIQDIAFDSGFSNLAHFNEQFKKLYGLTPRQYRLVNRGKYDLSRVGA
jgi:AraC-like DNA-binding protein